MRGCEKGSGVRWELLGGMKDDDVGCRVGG